MPPEQLISLLAVLPPSLKRKVFDDLFNEPFEMDVPDNIPLLTEIAA